MTTAYCVAYVDFDQEADAQKAIDNLNGKEVSGNNLQVDFYQRSQTAYLNSTSDVVGNENLRALFLKNIDKNVSIH